jgi:hypothetical protein
MRKGSLTTVFLIALVPGLALGQYQIKVGNDKPAVGEVVVMEVNAHPASNTSISWSKESGEGDLIVDPANPTKASFRPTKSGDTVFIFCQIKTPDAEFNPHVKLVVLGQTPLPSGEKPTAQPKQAAGPMPADQHHLPAGDLPLESIENVVPAGYMGDATSDNGETAFLDAGYTEHCHSQRPSCYHIVYRPGKVGWAAFAWQVVPEGTANWGEYPGADLSGRGYQSVRVWAKGEPATGGALPKIQFKSGGNVSPKFNGANRASHIVAGPTVELTAAGSEFCLDLRDKDLRNVVSPFTVVVTKASNPAGASIVLDSIAFSSRPCP